jgi:hypothetical protein
MEYVKQLADITLSDRNNCALNAMSIVLNKPYYEVYRTFNSYGRVGGRGASVRMITEVLNTLRWQKEADIPIDKWIKTRSAMPVKIKMSLANFAKQYPKGKYYVIKSRHALALIDGVWYDNQVPNPRSYVKWFFKVD